MKKIALLILCLVSVNLVLWGKTLSNGTRDEAVSKETSEFAKSLDTYLNFLAKHNPKLIQIQLEIESLDSQIPAVQTLPDPTLGVGIFLSEVETRIGPQQQKISIKQKLPWKGKLGLKGDVIRAQRDQKKAQFESIKRDLIAQFKKTYADFYYLGQEIGNTREHVAILNNFENVLTTKYENGLAPYANLIRVQLEKDKLNDRIEELETRKSPLVTRMMALMGDDVVSGRMNESINDSWPYPPSLEVDPLDPQTLNTIKNPKLDQIHSKVQQHQAILALEKKQEKPDFQVGLDWIGVGSAVMPDTPGSGRDAIALSVGLNLPVWKKKYRAMQYAETKRIEASEQDLVNTENQFIADLRTAEYQYEDALRKVKLYRDQIIPKAEETLSVLLTSFESDQASYLDILDAERALLEFSLSLDKAQTNVFKTLTEMERITD